MLLGGEDVFVISEVGNKVISVWCFWLFESSSHLMLMLVLSLDKIVEIGLNFVINT